MKKLLNRKKAVFIILVISIALLVSGVALVLILDKRQEPVDVPQSYSESYPVSEDLEGSFSNEKIFYIRKNNIYSYDFLTKVEEQITNYLILDSSPQYDNNGDQIPSITLNNLQKVNENSLGFSKCEIVLYNYGCGIYILNLEENTLIEKLKFRSTDIIQKLSFYTINKFAYYYIEESDIAQNKFILTLNDNREETIIENFTFEGFGRGGFEEDSEELSFSSDGQYLLNIWTSSPRSLNDFNTYIYNLSTLKRDVIEHSTQSKWLNNNEIIYRVYGKPTQEENGYLNIYNVDSKLSSRIDTIPQTANNPQIIDENNILYSDYNMRSLWSYNLKTKENVKIGENALAVRLLLGNRIVYSEYIECGTEENCGGILGPFEYGEKKILNLNSMKVDNLDFEYDFLLNENN